MTNRRPLAFLLAAGLLSGAALWGATGIASAHDFNGGGDCDSWSLVLDGTYGAHHILIDGVAQSSVKTSYEITDKSTAESRSFTVKWDKDSDDVTKTHTLSRDTDGCNPPDTTTTTTTTAPPTTTTVPDVTTTTVPVEPNVVERPAPAVPVKSAAVFTG
jgi:hypothetical protein